MSESQAAVLRQLSQGNVLKEQGRLEDAIQCYQEGLTLCPGNVELWFNMGSTLLELSRLTEAVAALQQAIALQPDYAGVYMNLGNAFKEQGRCEDAVQCFQKGLVICPGSAELWFNLGTTLLEVRRLPEAVEALQQAIALQPDFAAAYNNLGSALKEQGLTEDAIQCFQQGAAFCPGNAQLWFNLGTVLFELQRLSEAVEALKQAIALKPDFAGAYNNLGYALQSQGKVEDAIAAFDCAIALNPTNPGVHNNRAQAILLSGKLARGFAEYEWRTKLNELRHFYEWFEDKPRWQGENFAGKRLLVYDEQGCGDAIQFSRYLPLVKARAGIVQFSTKQPLLRLFANFPGVDELVEHTEAGISRTQSDLAVPLMSLPHILGTTLPTIPANIPYLTADRRSIDIWRSKMNCAGTDLRVGLVWAGNPANVSGQIRTCGLQAMSPLACIPSVTFYSLQKGEAAQAAHTPPSGMRLIDLTDDIVDFADTAALIMNLDLVVSVDTAAAHLAGALGKPVWTLLPAANEWRWLLARNDTPWYPTMRLFRQTAPGDWGGVMTAVAQELRKWKEM
ncbi:Beta-barrel assembly-enhancing protease [Sporomusa silvacetica DSM 10669]|uniref:Beta-barrel assembly-enhancing protease n=1 Tax=Sporomusa silvacetica DSM 10669 TaxID=1123289 RepID=A0ABZ3IHD2_9FIRM|nr:tetratricopeptide repeat protein [Sporomusa silvacetica]OZC22062.1 TPR repeat-containing protein YrrB [Sporomusa silvacetica DSM 10669]